MGVKSPRTFWEAIQLYHIATNIILIESNGHSISYGRLIKFLSYYHNINNGITSKEFLRANRNFFIKI